MSAHAPDLCLNDLEPDRLLDVVGLQGPAAMRERCANPTLWGGRHEAHPEEFSRLVEEVGARIQAFV
jgi:hypothetical protein